MSRNDVCFVGTQNYVLEPSFSQSNFQKGGVCVDEGESIENLKYLHIIKLLRFSFDCPSYIRNHVCFNHLYFYKYCKEKFWKYVQRSKKKKYFLNN